MAKKNELTVFYGQVVRETGPAWLIYDGMNRIWLPKALVKLDFIKGHDARITLQRWLAKEKGII